MFIPSIRPSTASWIGISKIARCLHTSITRRSFCWISFDDPLYAIAVASAITCYTLAWGYHFWESILTGENAIRKSSFRRTFDCCATSVSSPYQYLRSHYRAGIIPFARYTRLSRLGAGDSRSFCSQSCAVRSACRLSSQEIC